MDHTDSMGADLAMPLNAIIRFGILTNKDVASGHHGNAEVAKAAGLRGPVAYSLHYYGKISDLMFQRFGSRWLETGRMSVSFLRPVYADDYLRIGIGKRPLQRPEQASEGQLNLQVDVYNERDDLIAAGVVSVDQ